MTGGVAWQQGWWWTVLTAIYLHGGILHIFFNVMWIRNLGPEVGSLYGPARAFVLFSLSGAAGFVLSNVLTPSPSIGASGSIFGLLAALIVYGRKRGGTAMTMQLWQWAAIMFAMGFFMSGVNNWAHLGGFAGGWVTAEAMRFSDKRESRGVQILALALLATTAVGFVLSFVKVTGILRFDVGAYTAMSIDRDQKKARNAAKIVAAFIAAGSPPDLIARHGRDAGKVATTKSALAKFDFKAAGENVDDKTIDAFTIEGTPDVVKQKCDDLTKAGVTQIIFGSPLGPDMTNSIRLLGKYIV